MKYFIKKSDDDSARLFKYAIKNALKCAMHFCVTVLFVSMFFVSCTKVRFVVDADSELKELASQFLEQQDNNHKPGAYEICAARLSLIIQKNDDEIADSTISKKEVFREPLYPCIPFKEDYSDEDYASAVNYVFSEIPKGFIALKADGLYADNPEYPFWQENCVALELLPLPDEKTLRQNKIRLTEKHKQAFNKFQKNLNLWFDETDFSKDFVHPDNSEKNRNSFQSSFTPSVVFVAAVGDIMIARGVQDLMLSKNSAEAVFTDTMPLLINNDFTIGNLEGVVTDRKLKTPKTYNFKFNKKALPYLSQAGFDYLMLTNNHSYDYGEDGFKDTLAAVKNAGFATSGAGMNNTEAEQFYTTEIKGHTVSVISAGGFPVERSGFNGQKQASATPERAGILWKGDRLLELVREHKKTSDIVIVNMHAGTEYSKIPDKTQTEFYKALCENGADVVFGSHPHVLQPVEWYGNSLIVWSLGNYVFPGMDGMPGGTDTMIIRTGFVNGRLLYYEKYPAKIDGRCVRLK